MKSLTALFKPLEKLITEHGSATIQEKHIALLKTQASILEKENQNLKTEINDLRHKIQDCQNEKEKLQETIFQLRKQITPKTRRVLSQGIPPASVSSEAEPDDYRTKRKRLI